MKAFFTLLLSALLSGGMAQASTETDLCTLSAGVDPQCFRARLTPTVKATLVAYGNSMTTADLLKVEALFKERFSASTEQQLQIEIVDRALIPLAAADRDLSELRQSIRGDESRRSLERLTRLWYYYHSEPEQLVDEVHAELERSGLAPALAESDIVLVLSGPQFEGLGFATGAYGVTEQPTEIAWAGLDGGSTSVNTPENLVDELLHETGHLLGLDHASARCFSSTLPAAERMKCCQTSPGAQDVMSYCRDRSKVRGPYYFRYTNCTKDYLTTTTLPLLLNGGNRPFQAQPCD